MRKINLILLLFISLFNSCINTTTASMREEIIKKYPGVTEVGIIFDWTRTDDKYIALELKLDGGRKLFLTFVNWRKQPGREPFYLSSIGNYTFTQIRHFVYKDTKETYEVDFYRNAYLKLPYLSEDIGIQLKTIQDLITYYDDIYAFIESLPLISYKDNITFQKLLEKGELTKGGGYETEKYFVTGYSVKDIWSDEAYGEEWKDGKPYPRRPDYDNNEKVIDFYLYRPWERPGKSY